MKTLFDQELISFIQKNRKRIKYIGISKSMSKHSEYPNKIRETEKYKIQDNEDGWVSIDFRFDGQFSFKDISVVNFAPELSIHGIPISNIPKEVFAFTKLKVLRIYDSELGEIPEDISTFRNLETLQCNNNQIVLISPNIGRLKRLKFW